MVMVYTDLILNLALLVSLSVLSCFIEKRYAKTTRLGLLMQGFLFGTAAVFGMLRPLDLGQGVIFDGRSVMVSLCAFFFGPWAAFVASSMIIVGRIEMGGGGALTGVLVTLSSTTIGLLAHFCYNPKKKLPSTAWLYLFGLVVHIAMIVMMFTLPSGADVIKKIGLAIIILYPLATVLTGKILSDQIEAYQIMEALKEREERYERLFNSSYDAIGVHEIGEKNGEGRFVEVNDAACIHFGYSREELLKMTPKDIDAKEVDEQRANAFKKLLETGHVIFETIHINKSGKKVPVEISSRLFESQGKRYILSIARNISDRKRMEQELQQAQKLESIGRLAGGIAHDFNNMLSVILGYTELAISQLPPQNSLYADFVEIKMAAERSKDLTRQLLAFARKQTVSPKVLNLNETIESMLKMLRRLIGDDIELIWSPSLNLWPIKIDPSQIDQILANLCVNARDAISDVGKITIETSIVTLDKNYTAEHLGCLPGDYILLAVSDNGCGMDKETVSKLFEPFFTTKELGKGTGLGLATIYGIVRQNNGCITVYSEPNHGTTFKIYLPKYQGLNIDSPLTNNVQISNKGSETILVVENESSVLKLTFAMLNHEGYKVLAASLPSEAIQIAETYKQNINLLITDVVMPEMNGKELAKKLLSFFPNLKILFMSGYTANVIAHHGVLDEGVHFLHKPFSLQSLTFKVREVLDGKHV